MVEAADRRRAAALAGHSGDAATARSLLHDPDAGVRGTALAALARLEAVTATEVRAALADDDPAVRQRACEVSIGVEGVDTVALLADDDPRVAEVAAWALGERGSGAAPAVDGCDPGAVDGCDPGAVDGCDPGAVDGCDPGAVDGCDPGAVDGLAAMALNHPDALCREAAVAALGSIGHERGLPAILAATTDKATVRRRAVISLAPFSGPEVDAALDTALGDRDWQVRQAAQDLSGKR